MQTRAFSENLLPFVRSPAVFAECVKRIGLAFFWMSWNDNKKLKLLSCCVILSAGELTSFKISFQN